MSAHRDAGLTRCGSPKAIELLFESGCDPERELGGYPTGNCCANDPEFAFPTLDEGDWSMNDNVAIASGLVVGKRISNSDNGLPATDRTLLLSTGYF